MADFITELREHSLASANYALAIWQDADVDFILYQEALALAEEISVQSN